MKLRYFLFNMLLLILLLLVIQIQTSFGQCSMRPISLQERAQRSALIIEGNVISKESLWDDRHQNIYTIYTLDVWSVLKGELSDTLIHIIAQGGIVGDKMDVVTNTLELDNGKTGIFTLIPTNDPVTKPYALYEAYASTQGFIRYDKKSHKAKGVFDEYSTTDELEQQIMKHAPGAPKRRKQIRWNLISDGSSSRPHFHKHHTNDHHEDDNDLHSEHSSGLVADELYAESVNSVSAGASITSFSPTTVQSGIGTQLTINGSGFGASQGTGYVEFKDADVGGATYITPLPHQYISWSDTKIVVEVPTDAGTGIIRVTDGTNTATSSGTLTVEYAILNVSYTNAGETKYYRPNMVNDNSSGGYTFQMYTGFDANTSAKTDFTNVINQWVCATGVNWSFGSTTTTNSTTADGINVVRFDISTELASGVLGQAVSRYSGCISGPNIYWYLSEIDVIIDDGTNYFYGNTGSPSASQYDFYSVMLHEMGHAHQLGHVIDNTKVMHYSLSNGTQKRSISSVELTGAAYEITQSTAAGTCTQTAHVDYSCNPSVTLTTGGTSIAENAGSTTVTATLSKRSFSAVTVNLSFTGTGTSTTDYTLATSITIPSGSLSASITLTAVSDALYEGNETVIIDVSSVTNGTESGTQQRTVTITDDDTAPTVSLTTGATSISEAAATTSVTATLSAASGLATTVTLTLTGTATVTTDYTLTTTITIPAGSTSASNTLTAVNDVVYEGNETVIIDINAVTNATENGTQQRTVTITDNETAPTVSLTTGATSISEAAATTTVTATLSAASAVATTVTLTLTGTATVTSDYTLSTTITIAAGSTSASNTLTAVNDAIYEGNETVIIDISAVTNGTENGTQQRTVTITDNDTAPTVTLSTGGTSIAEAAGTTTVTATLSAASGLATTVTLTLTGTATVTTDYTLSTTITIPAGSTSASNTLTVVNDALYEGNETVIIDISAVTNGTESGTQQQTVTITDDDAAPTVTLTTGGTSIAETAGNTTVTATLSATSGLATTVTLTLTGTATVTTDYTLSTTITIPAGSTSASNTLTAVTDAIYEGGETVIVDISGVTNATESGTQQRTVTINDDDAMPTVTLTTGATSVAENAGTTTVTATVSAASGVATTVTLSLSGTATVTSDYTLSTTITIPAGSTSASNTLTVVNDVLYEGNETLIIDISGVTNATESGTQQKTVTITEDDAAPSVTLSTGATTVAENVGSTTVTATLSAASGLATTVTLSLSGTATVTTDYTLTTSISIPAGSTSGSLTLTSVIDALTEGDETVIIDISSVTNGTESGTQQKTVTILDNPLPSVTLSAGISSIVETSGNTSVTATLSSASIFDVTVNLSLSGIATVSTDYTLPVSITVPAGNLSASVTLASVSDLIYEGNETVIIDITSVTNGLESGTQQATITITEDDAAPSVTLSLSAATLPENGGSSIITATLSEVAAVGVTVNLSYTGTATSGVDYSQVAQIIVPAGSLTSTGTLNSTDDAIEESDETILVDIASITNGTGIQQLSLTIIDDEKPEINVKASATSIASAGTYDYGNVTVGNNSSVLFTIENTGTGTLHLTDVAKVILSGTNASDFTLNVSTLNSTIAAGASSDFTITFTSACGSSRTAVFTIASDDANEGSYVVNLTAVPVETTAPVADVAILSDITSQCSVTLTAPTATDNCSGTVTGTTTDPTTYSAAGSYVVTWTYTDNSGNTSSQTQNVTITGDVTAPQITCPADITSNSQIVTYTLPTVTDNCSSGITPALVSGLASGSVFPLGLTTVTFSATDGAGNSTTCSFTVTVNSATGALDALSAEAFIMYPNPCSDYVILDNAQEADEVRIYDNRGILVKTITTVQSGEKIGVADWADGLYMVQLIKGEQMTTHKLQLKR